MGKKYLKIIFLFIYFIFCILSFKAEAQLWEAIPPYNVLWPLWSPILSPPDAVSGKPTPLVDYLDKTTLLPVQPAFIWNPDLPYFNVLYNSPPSTVGSYSAPTLYYNDPTTSRLLPYDYNVLRPWPPSYLLETTYVYGVPVTGPVALTLPLGYENLLSFDPLAWLNFVIPLLNYAWQTRFSIYNPYLLTAADLYPADWIYVATYTAPLTVL